MMEQYERIMAIYLPAAEIYARCLVPPVRVITTDRTTFTASAAPAPLWWFSSPWYFYRGQ